jgi:hypothetical protein
LAQANFGFNTTTGIRPFLKLQAIIASHARNRQPFNFGATVLFRYLNGKHSTQNHTIGHQNNGLRLLALLTP